MFRIERIFLRIRIICLDKIPGIKYIFPFLCIWKPSHPLTLSVYVKLIDNDIVGYFCQVNPILPGLPVELKELPSTYYGFPFMSSPVSYRKLFSTGIFLFKYQGFIEIE